MTQFTCKGVKQINNRISFKHLYHSYLLAFFISVGVPNGEFPEILIAKYRSKFYFFVGGRSCGRLMSPVQETQSMREIRLLRGRLPRKEGGLTGMSSYFVDRCLSFCFWSSRCVFFFDLQILVTFKLCFLVYTYSRYRSETKVYTMMSN